MGELRRFLSFLTNFIFERHFRQKKGRGKYVAATVVLVVYYHSGVDPRFRKWWGSPKMI